MKINLINNYNFNSTINTHYSENIKKPALKSPINSSYKPIAYPAAYYVAFQGRVDKGLNSFCNRNKNYMPQTFSDYVASLSDEQTVKMTPLDAMCGAFEYLEICDGADDIKSVYPDEPLFQNLKSIDESRATKGLLYDIRLMKDDIEASGETILKNGEDLTVYLVKKIFLEGKYVKAINDDLDNDLNPVFQKENKNYLSGSTLGALGIKQPKTEFVNSLKYTIGDYSDVIAQKMKQRWQGLSDSEKASIKENLRLSNEKKQKTLTQDEKQAQKTARSNAQKQKWDNMTPQERTAQIQAMMAGSKKQKLIMINAWNKAADVREALSKSLTAFHISNPISKLYKTTGYSKEMSKLMTDFWQSNRFAADKMGAAITLSIEEYETAKKQNKEDEFADSIYQKRAEIIAEVKRKKQEDMTETAKLCEEVLEEQVPYCPDDFKKDYGRFCAPAMYAKVSPDFTEFDKTHPIPITILFMSRLKELLNCISDETSKKILIRYTPVLTDDEFNTLCGKIKNGELKMNAPGAKDDSAMIIFDRQPDREAINKNYRKYMNSKLSEKEIKEITKKIKQKIKADYAEADDQHQYVYSINFNEVKKEVLKLGPCAREILGDDEAMKEIILDIVSYNYVYSQASSVVKYGLQTYGEDEVKKVIAQAAKKATGRNYQQ